MIAFKKKKVAIIGLYYHPEMPSRVRTVYDYYKNNYDVKIITCDFVHPTKEYDKSEWDGCVKVHVPRYKSNFSVQRIISHISYAKQIDKHLNNLQPDLVYICVPPNYSALRAVNWTKKHNVTSIIDIVDIWPNANAPSNKVLQLAYRRWESIRDNAILRADKCLLECTLYEKDIPNVNCLMISLCKRVDRKPEHEEHEGIRIAYLGAFSTSYDFESLIYIAKKIRDNGHKIQIILIGKGDEKEKVIALLRESSIEMIDYGVVYDEEEKAHILETADFGYNGFVHGMAVGQSYKSLDYMGCGLALINTLRGDLMDIVEKENCGINFEVSSRDTVAERMCAMGKTDIEIMKNNAYSAFEKYFSWEGYVNQMDKIMKEVLL